MRRLLPLLALLACLVSSHASAQVGVGGVLLHKTAAAPAALPTANLVLNVRGDVGITSSTNFTWADQSGGGLGNLIASGAARPATGGSINGHNAVVFTAGNGLPSTSLINSYTAASTHLWTYMAVFKATIQNGLSTSGFPRYAPIIWGGTNSGATQWMGIGAQKNSVTPTTLDVYAMQWDTAEKAAIVTGALAANPHYLIGWYDGTNLNISVDGGAATTAASGIYATLTDAAYMGEGIGSTAEQWAGSILQCAAWTRVLSSGERTTVGTFVTTTWGAMGP